MKGLLTFGLLGGKERDWILSTSLQNLWITSKFAFSLIKGCERPPSASALYKHDERQLKWKKKRDGDKTQGSPFISGTGECDRILLRKKKDFFLKKKSEEEIMEALRKM